MKRLLTFAAVLALILSSAAFGSAGEVHDFGRFTLEVPKGWTASQTGDTGVVTRDDNMVQVTEPEKDSNGSYSFSAVNPYGAATSVSMTIFGENLIDISVVIAPGNEGAASEIDKILGSLSTK